MSMRVVKWIYMSVLDSTAFFFHSKTKNELLVIFGAYTKLEEKI